ncbi:DNA helicase, partial [Tanacetum coccineum]
MSLQYPLLFVFGQLGFYPEMVLKPKDGSGKGNKVSMNAYYKYHLHPRAKDFGLIFRCGLLFQQYVVTVFCAIKQYRLDWVHRNQKELRSDYLLGGPRYMYSHYLDALAICRSLGNPQYFITFTCNVKWPEIKRYIARHPDLTPSDREDIVCRVFEQKVNDFTSFVYNRVSEKRIAALSYAFMGSDRILAKVSKPIGDTSNSTDKEHMEVDKIKNYVDSCFVCPFEACWRIFDYPIHCLEPAVQILNVHLKNMQRVSFRNRDRIDIIVNMSKNKKTTLTK